MAVNHLRPEDSANYFERGAAQDGKANVIVRIVAERSSVEAGALVQLGAIEKVVGHGAGRLIDAGLVAGSRQPDGEVVINAADLVGRDVPVERQQNRHFVADFVKGRGKRSDHVGKAARHRERPRLGGNHQNFRHTKFAR